MHDSAHVRRSPGLRVTPTLRTYEAQLREEGKPEKEVLRCLKRQLSKRIFDNFRQT
jgi:hypothetical protein